MFDLFTYTVYLSLLATLILLTKSSGRVEAVSLSFDVNSRLRPEHFAALFILSFVVGFRYEVGVDWEGYRDIFLQIDQNPNLRSGDFYFEYGYFVINRAVSRLGLSSGWMFFVMALISWYFVFKSVTKCLLPFLIFFLFVDEYFFWSMNGVRQFAALAIWIASINYIINRELIKYIILLSFASLFHSSVLIFLPFYFIPYAKLYNLKFWIVLFFISLIVGGNSLFINLVQVALLYLGQKIEIIGQYVRYIDSDTLSIHQEIATGLGFVFKILINFLIIVISGSVVKRYPQSVVYFILFFIGAIFFNLSYNIQLVGRITHYFIILRSVILAIFVYHFWRISRYRIIIFGICFLYFMLFLVSIYNSSNMSSPFRFTFYVFHSV